jgi:hypothetical protein
VNQFSFGTALICSQRNPANETERCRSIPVFYVRDLEGPLMAKKPINDPLHWRPRAADMRALAVTMKDAETIAIMNRLADDYDKLAERAAQRRAKTEE